MSRNNIPEAYSGKESYIYVSYHHDDEEIAYDIISDLHARRYRVCYDSGFPTGEDYIQNLAEKIEKCELFFCILSPKYVGAGLCQRELNFALSLRKRVVPIKTDGFKLPDAMQFQLAAINDVTISHFPSTEAMIDYLCEITPDSLKTCHEGAEAAREEPRSKSAPPQSGPSPEVPEPKALRRSAPDLGDIGMAVLGAAGAVITAPITVPVIAGKFIVNRIADKKQKKEAKLPEQVQKKDSVNFSVLSPKAVKPDSYGVINLHMYTDVQREVVEQAIRESSGLVNETKKEGFEVSRGTSITARLESKQVEITDPLDTQVWNGKSLHFDFQFYVPQDHRGSQIAFVCYIECNGIPITRLNFITAVSRLPDSKALPAKVTKSDYKKAFISYSRKDEQRMLERVVGIQEIAPEMKFWLDKQSLDAGDVWREEIKKAITISDLLLLFWSVPASQSKQVEMEWSYALDQKGLSFIAPVPLDPPAMCPPPAQLKALNFTVRSFYQNEMTEKLSFYDSNNIEVL